MFSPHDPCMAWHMFNHDHVLAYVLHCGTSWFPVLHLRVQLEVSVQLHNSYTKLRYNRRIPKFKTLARNSVCSIIFSSGYIYLAFAAEGVSIIA